MSRECIAARSQDYVVPGVPRSYISSINGLEFRLIVAVGQGLTRVRSKVTALVTEPIVEVICKV